MSSDEWTCDGAKNKTFQGYLLCGFLAIVGLLFIFVFNDASPDATMIGFVQLLFSVLVGGLAYRGGRNLERQLVMNGDGISFRGWGTTVYPWHNVSSVEISGSRINAFLRINLQKSNGSKTSLKISQGDIAAPLDAARDAAETFLSTSH